MYKQTTFSVTSYTYIYFDFKTGRFYVMVLPGYGMSQYNPFTSLYSAMNEQQNIEAELFTEFDNCIAFDLVREG